MSKFMKFGIVLAFVLSLISVVTSLMLALKEIKYKELIKEKESAIELQSDNRANFSEKMKDYDKAVGENKKLNDKISQILKDIESANGEIKKLKDSNSAKDEEIKQLIKEKDGYINQLKEKPEDAQFAQQVESLKSKAAELEEKAGAKDTELADLAASMKDLNAQLALKDKDILEYKKREADLSSAINSLKNQSLTRKTEFAASVRERKDDVSDESKSARIEVVNRDMKFVVFSMGEDDGLKPGDTLKVYSGQRFLGEIYVDEVFQSMASASISDELLDKNISEGDTVKK